MEDEMIFAEMALELGLEPVVMSYTDFTVGEQPVLLPCFVLMTNSQAQDIQSAGYGIFMINNYYTDVMNTGRMLYKIVEAPMPIRANMPPLAGNPYTTSTRTMLDPNYRPSYLTEEQIAMDLEHLMLGHIEGLVERFHRNSNRTQRDKAIAPIVEYVHNISKIITERLTEMEIKINGRNRKIIRKDTPNDSRPEEGLDTGIRSSTGESERSVGAGEIRTDTNGSFPRPDSRYGLTEAETYIPQSVEERIRPAISGRSEEY